MSLSLNDARRAFYGALPNESVNDVLRRVAWFALPNESLNDAIVRQLRAVFPGADPNLSVTDLIRLWWGAQANESVTDAEYNFLT